MMSERIDITYRLEQLDVLREAHVKRILSDPVYAAEQTRETRIQLGIESFTQAEIDYFKRFSSK